MVCQALINLRVLHHRSSFLSLLWVHVWALIVLQCSEKANSQFTTVPDWCVSQDMVSGVAEGNCFERDSLTKCLLAPVGRGFRFLLYEVCTVICPSAPITHPSLILLMSMTAKIDHGKETECHFVSQDNLESGPQGPSGHKH